ncbi:MAG: hypothetical protein QM535_01260 [Limnohabitans sp.]|nr:hypothetical protein [Limnohabitans sp.]
MKLYIKYLLILITSNVFSQTNNLQLIAVKNESAFKIDFTLKVKNNGDKTINFLKINDTSIMGFGNPIVEFIAETKVSGKWRKFKDPKINQIDYTGPTYDSIVQIKPNEEAVIGNIFRARELNSWFTFLDDANINLYFTYKSQASSLKEKKDFNKLGLQPITLISNKIEYKYMNGLTTSEYNKVKQDYIGRAFSNFINKKYTSTELLKILKPIKNKNGENKEILKEALGDIPFKFISNFGGRTKDKKSFHGILYKIDNHLHLGIYAGKHFFIERKSEDEPLQYLFGEIPYDENILENYLYKD